MLTENEKVDCIMRQLKISKQSHIKHVSFANSTMQERIRVLQLNKHTNMRLRYESLNNLETLDKLVFNQNPKLLQKV